MKAELIFTGTELLLGHILNSHAQYLGMQLSGMGIEVVLHTTVGDDRERMSRAFREAIERSDLIIITGGLGPTTDDLTMETVASVLGLPLVLDERSLAAIEEVYQRRGLALTEGAKKQAYFPEGAAVLPNTRGTAPGALIEKDGKIILILPGPPHELTAMFENSALPFLSEKAGKGAVMRYKVFKLTGITESMVQEKLKDLGGQGNPEIAYMAKPGEIQVRIQARAGNSELAQKMVDELADKIRPRLEEYIFGCGEETLEGVVGKLLLEKRLSLSVAESCTGGLIAARLTDIPGSSEYFKGGVVAYSNEMKKEILGVPQDILEQHGAVSRETAVAMAEGMRRMAGSDLSIGVTGIAGPGGGTEKKPRGLVYISLSYAGGAVCHEYLFPGERPSVRQFTANTAMNILRRYLLTKPD
ncbi:MAG: competence/damage-inducible protein A [Pelotomaculum sp.]|nr:competence/damage-inducible protein A [Pelotomaculum sp.]